MSRFPSPFLAALPLLASLAAAQTDTIIDRANQGPPAPPAGPLPPSDSSSSTPGSGSDEGTQRVAEPRRLPFKFSASVDQQFYSTNNVFLSPDDNPQSSEEAIVSVTTLGLVIETLPVVVGEGQLTSSLGFSYQRYVHGIGQDDVAIEDLDFESYSLPLGLAYRWGRGWEANAGITLGQLYSVRGSPAHEKLYADGVVSTGLRNFTELRRNLYLSSGLGLAYAETWTSLHDVPSFLTYRDDRNDKLDATIDAALYFIRDRWTLVPYVSLRQTHYYHYEEAGALATGGVSVDRDDTTLTAGLSLSWAFADWGSARLFTSYDERLSNQDKLPYDYTYGAGTVGLGASLNLRY